MKIQRSGFTCVRDGLVIRGNMFRPEGDNLPIAIISHGFMANQQTVFQYAKQFAKWGYASFCFDFNGGCLKGKSDGRTTDMTVLTEREDLKEVIAYAKSLAFTDSSQLVLMGCSQGGFVSALTAAQLQEQVSKLILFYPALCIPDDARKGKMILAKFDPDNIPETVNCGPMKLGRCYPACVKEMDPFAEISPYQGPVLIVHGDADKIVNVSYAVKARNAYQLARKEAECHLKVIKGAGHGFGKRADRIALACVRRFLSGEEKCGEGKE